jgi:hypothetical protein
MTKKTLNLFKKACKALGYDPETVLPDVSLFPEHHRKSLTAYAMLVIIIEDVQKRHNWTPDYFEPNNKYWTWHWVKASKDKPAGFGFSDSGYGCDNANSIVGSRLCFPSAELEMEYREPLEELYLDYKLMT